MSNDDAEQIAPPVILWEPVIDKTPVLLHMPDVGTVAPPVVLDGADTTNEHPDALAAPHDPSSDQSSDGLPAARSNRTPGR